MTNGKNQSKQKLPKWFDGEHYSNGDTVNNPFTGEEYYLNRTELSMYDFIKGAEFMIGMNRGHVKTSEIIDDMRKALDWFRQNNAKAYMILLD